MKTTMFAKPIIKNAHELQEGDIIENARLGNQVFLHFKRGGRTFISKLLNNPESQYRTRVMMASKFTIVGTAVIEKMVTEIELLRKAPKGTLFVIKERKSASLFSFEKFSPSGKIIAKNPLTGDGFTIASSFPVKLISNIPNAFHI